MVVCYMVVTPDPRTTVSESYYVKFGDGPSHAAYYRCNPDHAYEANDRSPAQYLNVVTYDASLAARQPGKWLEWIHIKITGGMRVYANTEWHMLQWNRWEEIGGSVDNPTSNFENIVDNTWWCDNQEAIAQFVN
ncbi:hypothetical protein N7447_004090 [Penicillium robsamsonii]|uniref:uncharacterized protein n=1 Tax=Penicillium robsamsonii TaxID=1792511 RepID=UPI002546D5BC|nr:uncharacterized protein N7447_004090 [Penicillium robsamsonii]KAJ5827327.1 hypothetical protein N7447_004090 [Penicillium robsamsonii]